VEKIKKDKKSKNADIDYAKLEADLKYLTQKINIENSVNLSSYIMYRKYVLNLFYEGLE
jgi:trans-2-enoyl-CoA reductase